MNKATERKIQKIYELVFKKIYSKTRMARLARGDRRDILKAASKLEASKAYNEFAKKFAEELTKKGLAHEKGVWRKFFEASRKMNVVAYPNDWNTFEKKQMEKFVKQNFTMIKSIPQETLKIMEHKYTTTLIQQVAEGKLPRGSFERQLRQHGVANAKVIARTEAAKLQTDITRARASTLGSVGYIWMSSNDKRTRPSHRMMNGVFVFWSDKESEKPHLDNMIGDCGEFPNCRCTPVPVYDEYDLNKNSYKYYDPNTHKIVNISKTDLLKKMVSRANTRASKQRLNN